MKRIFTHVHVDLDAALSAAFVKTFVTDFKDAELVFVPAQWQGVSTVQIPYDFVKDQDIAVDVEAGGFGIKGDAFQGRVGSAFSTLVKTYGTPEMRKSLKGLCDYLDREDTGQSHVSKDVVTLGTVLHSLRFTYPENKADAGLVQFCSQFLYGFYQKSLNALKAQEVADQARVFGSKKRKVALVTLPSGTNLYGVTEALFKKGIHVVVYVDGNNVGAMRSKHCQKSLNHPSFRKVVNALPGEDWFIHKDGFLVAHGTQKSPRPVPSKVKVMDLVNAGLDVLT